MAALAGIGGGSEEGDAEDTWRISRGSSWSLLRSAVRPCASSARLSCSRSCRKSLSEAPSSTRVLPSTLRS